MVMEKKKLFAVNVMFKWHICCTKMTNLLRFTINLQKKIDKCLNGIFVAQK
jgi:hypothetical protein